MEAIDTSYKALIEKVRTSSLKYSIKEALSYHYKNFIELEKRGNPYSILDQDRVNDSAKVFSANTVIKFEVQAYVCQFRRLKHFINYFQNIGMLFEPTDPTLKEVWFDLMDRKGVVNLLANKWAVHRSVDYPEKEDTERLHIEVLLNLEGTVTSWGNGHLFLSIGGYSFYLFEYHHKVLRFVDWVFETIEVGL